MRLPATKSYLQYKQQNRDPNEYTDWPESSLNNRRNENSGKRANWLGDNLELIASTER
jgi:hypothetical protein